MYKTYQQWLIKAQERFLDFVQGEKERALIVFAVLLKRETKKK
jgi:hypothetical protein